MPSRTGALVWIACLLLATAGCQDLDMTEHAWDSEVRLPAIEDLNPDPGVIEINLVARVAEVEFTPGVKTRVYTYNGTTPGPLIEGRVGDLLIVHFTNRLPVPTTIHWHGVDVPALMDGTHMSQHNVEPNGGTFLYQFKLNRAATYWYHPHVRENEQIEMGLYGALVVRDPIEETLAIPRNEMTLILDDILLDEAGQVAPTVLSDPVAWATRQANGREGNLFLVNGRATPTVRLAAGTPVRMRLINAANSRFMRVSMPGHTIYRIGGDGGLLEYPLELPPIDRVSPDAIPTMDHSGHGGHGAAAPAGNHTHHATPDVNSTPGTGHHPPQAPAVAPSPTTDTLVSNPDANLGVLLTPAERADVVFIPTGNAGSELLLEWHDFPRGRHNAVATDRGIDFEHAPDDGRRPPSPLVKFQIVAPEAGAPAIPMYELPERLTTIKPIDITRASALPVVLDHTMPDARGNIRFFAAVRPDGTGIPFDALQPEDIMEVRVGETRVWEVTSRMMGDHNFHSHGFTFQHAETIVRDAATGRIIARFPAPILETKDTIRIPGADAGTTLTLRLAAQFTDAGREGQIVGYGMHPEHGHAGGWMFHCHILEHGVMGMMSYINVR